MARIREYNEDRARASLMTTFLTNGYEGTSLSDLEEQSGLNRRQIYNDFGDKRTVFLRAVEDFMTLAGKQFLGRLEHSEDGVASIEETLHGMTKVAETRQGRLGCLVCNTAREQIAKDPDVRSLIERFFRRIEKSYRVAIERAIRLDEIDSGEDARSLGRFFLGIHVSLCVMSRGGESAGVLRDIADQAIRRVK